MIRLEDGDFGWDYIVADLETGDEYLVQTDWDYSNVASAFGWSPCHGETDGTVDCPVCNKTATELIREAQNYLDEHIGDTVDDPGYFSS